RLERHFYFSSGRRHTRFSRDWSSDVCSSDLKSTFRNYPIMDSKHSGLWSIEPWYIFLLPARQYCSSTILHVHQQKPCSHHQNDEIGRASCRARGASGGSEVPDTETVDDDTR